MILKNEDFFSVIRGLPNGIYKLDSVPLRPDVISITFITKDEKGTYVNDNNLVHIRSTWGHRGDGESRYSDCYIELYKWPCKEETIELSYYMKI